MSLGSSASGVLEPLMPLENVLAENLRQALSVLSTVPGILLELRCAGKQPEFLWGINAGCPDSEAVAFIVDAARGIELRLCHAEQNPVVRSLVEATIRTALEKLEIEKREELLLDELSTNWESLEAIYEISTDILRFGDIGSALGRLIERFSSLQDGLKAALYLGRQGQLHPIASTPACPGIREWLDLGSMESPVRERRATVINHIPGSSREFAGTPWSRAMSVAAAPLTSRQKNVIGVIAIWRDDRRFIFDAPFSRLFEAIAYQASMLLESDRLNRTMRENERLAQEIEIASSIQETLLFGNPPQGMPRMQMASFSKASQRIDGDFHDFLKHGEAVDVLIGDVMGKGVAAALLGAAAKNQFLRAIAKLAARNPGGGMPEPVEIVRRAASRLGERLIALERFVTLCYARFDPDRGVVEFVDGGHTGILVHRKQTRETYFLRGDDLPIGVEPQYRCEQNSAPIAPGDTFVLFSDGVPDTRSPEGEAFGEERLIEAVENWASLGPSLLLGQIQKNAAEFANFGRPTDDFTCIAVQIRLGAEQEPVSSRSAEFRCGLGDLAAFRDWVGDAANEVPGGGLDEDGRFRLELATTEAYANSVRHGLAGTCAEPLRVRIEIFPNHLKVEMRHKGPPFNPLTVPGPSFDGSRDGGFGTFIIMRSADELVYGREDETNLISISIMRGENKSCN